MWIGLSSSARFWSMVVVLAPRSACRSPLKPSLPVPISRKIEAVPAGSAIAATSDLQQHRRVGAIARVAGSIPQRLDLADFTCEHVMRAGCK